MRLTLYSAVIVLLWVHGTSGAEIILRSKRDSNVFGSLGTMFNSFFSSIIHTTQVDPDNPDKQGLVDSNGKLFYCTKNPRDCDYLLCLADNFEHDPKMQMMKQGAKVLMDRDMRQALENDPLISKLACDKVGLDELGCKGFRSFLGLIDMIDPNKGDPMKPTQTPPPDKGPLSGLLGGNGLLGGFLGGVVPTGVPTGAPTGAPEAATASTPILVTAPTPIVVTAPTPAPPQLPIVGGGTTPSTLAPWTPVTWGHTDRPRRDSRSTPNSHTGANINANGHVDLPLLGHHRLRRDVPSTTTKTPGKNHPAKGSVDYTDFYGGDGKGGSGSGSGGHEVEPDWKPRDCNAEFFGKG